MMAAAQPFLSGAISKTINMPEDSTVEDIMQAYIESWKLGIKAVAIYRDNSKGSQPLSAAGNDKKAAEDKAAAVAAAEASAAKAQIPSPEQQELFARAKRRKLPSERHSITHKFSIGGHEGYITVGMYEDGEPGEIFIKMAKEGSTLSGFMDGFRAFRFHRLAVRRAAQGAGRQIRQHALRTLRLHRQPANPLRQVDRSITSGAGSAGSSSPPIIWIATAVRPRIRRSAFRRRRLLLPRRLRRLPQRWRKSAVSRKFPPGPARPSTMLPPARNAEC